MKKSLFTKQMSFIRREMHFYVSVNFFLNSGNILFMKTIIFVVAHKR